ncbi:hypothetical protein WJX84_002281 [Apatococcus fuscideae]|uniref:Arginine biosynthesis bifunctional protein ArgJ, chloroplastic n=1 Tax=Apatococcus fuscideae TaxID=2026836 RepID=A0AAW1T9T0_9CHLO
MLSQWPQTHLSHSHRTLFRSTCGARALLYNSRADSSTTRCHHRPQHKQQNGFQSRSGCQELTPQQARQHNIQQRAAGRSLKAAARQQQQVQATSTSFDLEPAPILIPDGPWKEIDGCVCAPKGFRAQGMHGGLRAATKKADLALIVADDPAVAAGVFTLNVMCAAPVNYCREVLAQNDTCRAILINAGQANAATGDQGYQDCITSAEALASALGVSSSDILLESTGVIGRRIKIDELVAAIPKITQDLENSAEAAMHAAIAITTTDLVSKSAAIETSIGGRPVRIGGIAKGSGMIHPNMATMLGVITTDAAIAPPLWRAILQHGVAKSFNQITVDGDTSTNDCVLGLASGKAGGEVISDPKSSEAKELDEAVTALLQGLAKSVAWDGEGATCLIEVTAKGAQDDAAAAIIARSVAASSLVKAAVYGHDPNWGRIACAAGYAGVPYNQNEMFIRLGDIGLMEGGQPLPFDKDAASKYLKDITDVHGTVYIELDVGTGPGKGIAWGCDLSYDYVKINAEYTT